MKVILVGYMGSGKSVVAQKLAQKLQIPFVDLDELIEKNQKSDVKTIFSDKGELFFRKLEHQIFTDLLQNSEPLIISTGGGTPCYFNNHELFKADTNVSFYLKASIETLVARLEIEKQSRPLIARLSENEFANFVAKHLFERSFYYYQAQFVIDVDDKSVEEIAVEIQRKLT